MGYLTQFQKHIQNNDYPSFLNLWEEYCLGDEVDTGELKTVLSLAKTSELASHFGKQVESGLELWKKIPEGPEKDEILRLIFDLQTLHTPFLADLALEYLKTRYGSSKFFSEKLKFVGLRDKVSFKGAIRNFELLNHFQPGNFLFHTGGWGVGEIVDVSFIREQIGVEFDLVAGKKELSFQNSFNTVIPIPKEHFLARRFGNADALEALAKEDPVGVIRMMLSDIGPLSAQEIKDELCDLVIPADEWPKWWQNTRTKIKKDTMIESPEELKAPFKLRTASLSHEDKLLENLRKKPSAAQTIQMSYSFLRDFPHAAKEASFREELHRHLTELLSTELSDSEEVSIHFLLEDLSGEEALASGEIIRRLSSIPAIIRDMEILSYKKRILSDSRRLREDWISIFQDMLIELDINPLRDYILSELLQSGNSSFVIAKLEDLIAFPSRHPHAFMWYLQKITDDETLPLATVAGRVRFFESMLILLNLLEQQTGTRDIVKRILHYISNARFANVRKIFQEASKDHVQEFLLLASKCHSLTDHDIKILHSLAEVVHPSLKKLRRKKDEVQTEEETPLWTTKEGYLRIKDRIQQIATVETVENAKEIERAREHGDLRENAEFKSALERRDRLQAELKFLSDQFSQARILSPEDISCEVIGIGTVVDFVSAEGSHITYTILGPWDADVDSNILSFQSKIAQGLLGKALGDTVHVQGKVLTVHSIKSYLG